MERHRAMSRSNRRTAARKNKESDGAIAGSHQRLIPESSSNAATHPYHFHPLCNTTEFAKLIRRDDETVRRMIRRGQLAATGRPALIHVSEALRFGLTIEDAREILIAIRSGPHIQDAA